MFVSRNEINKILKEYSVKQVAEISGVSPRTLHHYDKIGLLIPATRTQAGYRSYGEAQLLLLQQILFLKKLQFSLLEIKEIISDPAYDLIQALRKQKASLSQQQANLKILLNTIDNTIRHLNQEIMLNPEDLYHGLKKGTAQQYREEAIKKYGRTSVEKSEHALIDLGKNGFRALVTKQKDNAQKLYSLRNLDPKDEEVQKEMEEHYQIIRQFWAKDKADAQLA